jgi:hypothetical protein
MLESWLACRDGALTEESVMSCSGLEMMLSVGGRFDDI